MYWGMNRNESVALVALILLVAVGIGAQSFLRGSRQGAMWVEVGHEPPPPAQSAAPGVDPAPAHPAAPLAEDSPLRVGSDRDLTDALEDGPASDAPQVAPAGEADLALSGDAVDINRADEMRLQDLWNVGPTIAARIVESRQRDGPFRRPEDLMRVKGIGPATFERNRTRIVVSSPPGQ